MSDAESNLSMYLYLNAFKDFDFIIVNYAFKELINGWKVCSTQNTSYGVLQRNTV